MLLEGLALTAAALRLVFGLGTLAAAGGVGFGVGGHVWFLSVVEEDEVSGRIGCDWVLKMVTYSCAFAGGFDLDAPNLAGGDFWFSGF